MEDESKDGNNAVNIIELFRLLREQRWLAAKITGVFVILGIIVALFSPVEYTSEALLMPEAKDSKGTAGDLLESYGGMLGLGNLGSMSLSKEGTIAPQVYPKIMKSLTFQDKLLQKDIYFSGLDTTVSGYTYFKDVRGLSFFEFLIEYTIGLPGKFSSSSETKELPDWLRKHFNEEAVIELSKNELEVIQDMKERVMIELNSQTGVLTISATMPDAVAAAQVNQKVIDMLKEFIKAYSTQKAKEDLAFAKSQHRQAQKKLREAQSNLASFLDQNVNLATAKSKAKEQRLQAEFDLAYNMYNSVSQQLMEAKMKVQEQTPVFKPLQAVNVPNQKSEPQRMLIVLLSFFIGLVVSFFFIAGRDVYHKVTQKM